MGGPVEIIEPPASSIVMQITSPAFRPVAPEIINPGLIPDRVVAASWAERESFFAPGPVTVWLLQDVFVACEGLVFDRHGALYGPSITQHTEAEIDWATEQVQRVLAGGSAELQDRVLILGKKRGAGNYGHWLMEMLPMLHLVVDRLRGERIGALVHDVGDPQLGGVMQTSLRRIGLADARVSVAGNAPVRVSRLILVDGLTRHGVYMSPLVRDCHERLMHGVGGAGHERVFVARGTGMRRDFADPSRAEAVAREAGFHVIRTDGLSLVQQISAVRDARVVAGAMGAAMTNLAFARTPAQAILFAGAEMPDTFFWFVANHFGHRYREIRCLQADADATYGASYDRTLLIADEELRRCLRMI